VPATPEQDPLFDAARYAPKPRKEVPPAYRPGRALAQAWRDETLAEFRRHQHECAQCGNAWEVSQAKGTKAHWELCVDGYVIFYRFAHLDYRLGRGYYPDHEPRKTTAAAKPPAPGQGVLF
jgi:hypothetical protein